MKLLQKGKAQGKRFEFQTAKAKQVVSHWQTDKASSKEALFFQSFVFKTAKAKRAFAPACMESECR